MSTVLIIVGFCLLILPGIARPISLRIDPRRWTTLCVIAFVTGLTLIEIGLLALSAIAFLANNHSGCSSNCVVMMTNAAPGGVFLGWVGLVIAVVLAVLAIRAFIKARQTQAVTRIESFIGRHSNLGQHELVVLDTQVLVALSVNGHPGQVLISEGLLSTLEPHEMAAVLNHELAHLDHSHHRYLLVAFIVEATFGRLSPIKRSADALRLGIERWADETAASTLQDGRCHVRSALLHTVGVRMDPAIAGFSALGTVVERLNALEAPLPNPPIKVRSLLYMPGTVLGVIAVGAATSWLNELHLLLLMADRCHL